MNMALLNECGYIVNIECGANKQVHIHVGKAEPSK